MIDNLHASLLTNEELPAVAQEILDATQELPSQTLIEQLQQMISRDIDDVEAALARPTSSQYTAKLAELDRQREAAFVGLRDFSYISSKRPDPQLSAAGRRIYDIFRARGLSLHRLSYRQQTTALRLLFEDLSSVAAQQDLTTLAATSWFVDLQTAQEKFEQTMAQRATAESQSEVPRLAPSRSKLANHLDTLIGNIEVLRSAAADGRDDETVSQLDDLISVLNEIIGSAMSMGRARKTREESVLTREKQTPDTALGSPANEMDLAVPAAAHAPVEAAEPIPN